MMKSVFSRETFSSFEIASLPNWESAKYAGGSRPSCSVFRRIAVNEFKMSVINWRLIQSAVLNNLSFSGYSSGGDVKWS